MSEKLNEIFNIPNEEEVKELTVIDPLPVPTDPEKDIEKVRQVHHDLLEKSQEALDNLMNFAKASDSPRAYEIVAELIRTTSEVSKNLIELNTKNKKDDPKVQNNTQNNIFVGSTAELQKFLSKMDDKTETPKS